MSFRVERQLEDKLEFTVERSPHAKLHNGFKKACRTQDTDAVRRKHNNSE